ncbi:MAG TPA: nucleoside-diphosphate sugar epimerase/dehydratase [Chitinophagaceae bacterium]|nr:nucleoside-diphosphate sugar epimerase/dehydratase [Chitinophagaceae bacterium]
MKKFILTDLVVPRWIILIIDSLIYLGSYIISLFFIKDFNPIKTIEAINSSHILLYLFASLGWYLYFHLHTGLLRYSNSTDFFRIIRSNIFTHLSVILIHLIAAYLFNIGGSLPLKEIGLSFFVSSSFLIFLRILVKGIFISYFRKGHTKNQVPVLIYGSGTNAIMIKNALENLPEQPYEIVGFIDHHKSMIRNNIEQIKVHHYLELVSIKKSHDGLKIIMTNDNLNNRYKKILVNLAIKYNIKIITIPPVQKWLEGSRLQSGDIKHLRIEDLLQRDPIQIDDTSISKYIDNKKVLVTGAAGSIGFEIALQLCKYNPSQLILCDIAESALHEAFLELQDMKVNVPIEVAVIDIRNTVRMNQLFKLFDPKIIFHAAAYKHVPLMENNPYEAINTNINATKILADLAVEHNVEKFVMISTDKAVNPTNVMGASKRIAEIYVQSLSEYQKQKNPDKTSTQFVTTRFGNVLGSNGSVIPRFRKQIERGGPLTVTHPEITRYFMTISEAVQLVLQAGSIGSGGEIYVFDMGEPVKLYDMAIQMIKLSGLKPDKEIKIVFTGLRPGEKLFEELLNDDENTLPTHHSKIRVASTRAYSYETMSKEINYLISLTKQHNNNDMVRQMKKIVPEYLSENSIYSNLDQPSTVN